MKIHLTNLIVLLLIVNNATAQTLPKPNHVVLVMLENKGYNNIVGSSNAPYINSLIGDTNCALFSDSHGITHPSQPNYLHLYSGDNQGVTNDNQPSGTPYSTCNLGASLIGNGYTFKGFSEDLPAVGDPIFTAGTYVKRHCPWAYWIGTGTNQISATTHQPYSNMPTNLDSLPTVSFIIPNNAHNMHDPFLLSSVAISAGDTWLSNNLPALVTWAKSGNNLLIIHYDEDESLLGLPTANTIATMFIGKMVQGGTYNNNFNHHDLLKTIADMYTIPACGGSASKQAIINCWRPQTANALHHISNQANVVTIYPMPATQTMQVTIENSSANEMTSITLYDIAGKLVQRSAATLTKGNNTLTIDVNNLHAGTYLMHVLSNTINESEKIQIK
ncbi:MAG: alkaline phosphatase family protein [Bacteroidia bacterium]